MKKAYKFDGMDQLNQLVEKYGKDHFDFVPEKDCLGGYPHRSGYLYHDSGSVQWTSGDPDTDARIVYFEQAMQNCNSIDEEIQLAKSYLGKRVNHASKFTVESVCVVLSEKDAESLRVGSIYVLEDIKKNGYSVVVSGSGFSLPVMKVTIEPEILRIKLNNSYDAVVTKDTIVVGCQTFPISILDELNAAREKFNEN